MIELTDQQTQALNSANGTPARVVNPRTNETFVLLRIEDYEKLADEEYDDSPWTEEELMTLAWEAGKNIGWEEMDEYDDYPENP